MDYRNPSYEEEYDFPRHMGVPQRTYMVATTPRSGSSLLAFLCRQSNGLGFPLEYFTPINRAIVQRRLGLDGANLARYAQALVAIRTSPNGLFGFKLHFGELEDFRSAGGFDLPLFEELHVILLERQDRLSQAISLVIASRTNAWIDLPGFRMPGDTVPVYNRQAIAQTLDGLDRQQAQWLDFLGKCHFPVLQLAYEDLLDDCARTFGRISAFLGVTVTAPDLARVGIRKQGDTINREWKQRYLSGE